MAVNEQKSSNEIVYTLSFVNIFMFNINLKFSFKAHSSAVFCLILLLSSMGNCLSQPADAPYIVKVSTANGYPATANTGSLVGGTKLIIQAIGLSPQSSNILIKLGDSLICQHVDINVDKIECVTPTSVGVMALTNLPITIWSNGIRVAEPYYGFSYADTATPYLWNIHPSSAVSGTTIQFIGSHKIKDTGFSSQDLGQVYQLKIGDSLCQTLGLQNYTDSNSIKCYTASQYPAGKYVIKEHVMPGFAWKSFKMRRTSFQNQFFQFATIPQVFASSPSQGAISGNDLTIYGGGFSTDEAKIQVSVDGVLCDVTQSTIQQIKCRLRAKNSTHSSKIDSQSGASSYIMGSGFKYGKFNLTNKSIQTPSSLRSNINSNLIYPIGSGIRYQTEEHQLEANMGVMFKGFFKAPVNGTYTFNTIGSGKTEVYLNNVWGQTTGAASPIISSTRTTSTDSYYFDQYIDSRSIASVTLEAGKYYFMEVYSVNLVANGWMKVNVQVPNTDRSLVWQTHEVVEFRTSLTNKPEYLSFNVSTDGNYTIAELNVTTRQPIYKAQLKRDATVAQFQAALSQFPRYAWYGVSVTSRQAYKDGVRITDPALQSTANKFVYRVSVENYRDQSLINQDFHVTWKSASQGIFAEEQDQAHSPLMSGYFGINITYVNQAGALQTEELKLWDRSTSSFNNKNINFGIDPTELQSAIRNIKGFQMTEVRRQWNVWTGARWVIDFFGVNYDIDNLSFDFSMLDGGKIGTKPQITFTELRKYSSNLLFSPVDFNFMYEATTSPNILVSVDGIMASCGQYCAYNFDTNVPEITATSISSNILNIIMTNPNNFVLSNIEAIMFDQLPCINPTGTFANLSCTLRQNSDLTPTIRAGEHMPTVKVRNFGYVLPQPSVATLDFLLTVKSITNSSGGSTGGYQATIQGTGFPLSPQQALITVCNQNPTILSINNIQARIIMPPCAAGTQDVTVTYKNTYSDLTTFTYDAAANPAVQIHSISPISSSPVLKKIMEITGTGFGINSSAISVHLSNSSGQVYQLRVVESNNTYIKCGIPGGLPGEFRVSVSVSNTGDATPVPADANKFTYELLIYNVTPSTGSHFGGTLVKIQGKNFSPNDKENLVFVGNQLNQFCEIQSFTSSEILCRTPMRNQYYTNASNRVYMSSKLIQDAVCSTGTCNFTFMDEANSPKINQYSGKGPYRAGDIISLNGTNLDPTSTKIVLNNANTGHSTVINPTSNNGATIQFTIPLTIEAGTYQLRARVDPIGQSNGVQLNIVLSVLPLTTSQFSREGSTLTITGTSLPSTWPNKNFQMYLKANNQLIKANVQSTNPTEVKISLPKVSRDTSYSLQLVDEHSTSFTLNFSQVAAKTPILRVTLGMNPQLSTDTTVVLSKTTLPSENPTSIKVHPYYNQKNLIEITNIQTNSTNVSFNVSLPSGTYKIKALYGQIGWAEIQDLLVVTISPYSISSSLKMSYNGGQIEITGYNINLASKIQVGGFDGQIIPSLTNANKAVFQVPVLLTPKVHAQYPKLATTRKISPKQFTMSSDVSAENALRVVDDRFATQYSSNNSNCFISIDLGDKKFLKLESVKLFPSKAWDIVYTYLKGAVIQGSNDNLGWTTLKAIDMTIHAGWNILKVDLPANTDGYRYYRFSHNSTSKCAIAELQFYGIVYSNSAITSTLSNSLNVIFKDGGNSQTFTNALQFRDDQTPVVNTITPNTGSVFGGQIISIAGTFPASITMMNTKVTIDDVACLLIWASSTQINCTTGSRSAVVANVNKAFEVIVDNKRAINHDEFKYVLRWSDIRTWGTDLLPVQDDLIFVPKGMNLFVDISTPKVQGIVVQGSITFADQRDMHIRAGFITVRYGTFLAGTQQKPYQHKLTFEMSGSYYGKQQPMFGNKGIGCYNCRFSMYGTPKQYTWTMLGQTVQAGATQIRVEDPVDWSIGDMIVIASTSFDHNEAEQRVIQAISGTTITLDKPLEFKHLSEDETHGNHSLKIKAEVGMYTRNIKMTGDQVSSEDQYGSHLLMTGSSQDGFEGHIGYTEFTKCGQPRVIGRYCMHFHMVGDAMNSYAIGNAVHHSFARVITIHGTHFLRVKHNVGYQVKGHNFFLEDGIQTNNIIEYNLAIKSLESWTMLQSDISVASFWITNPFNHLRYNHAAGGDFYGFWYQIKEAPDGPSATTDVCPEGYPLGQSHDNVAHSYKRFGLRLFVLTSRQNPCQKVANTTNPSIQSKFYNYLLYRNKEAGLLHEYGGHIKYENFTVAENIQGNIQFYSARRKVFDFVEMFANTVVYNSAIIGYANFTFSTSDQAILNAVNSSVGILTPQQDNLNISKVNFYNFGTNSTVIQTCAKCYFLKFTNEAWQVFISKITFNNVNGRYLAFGGLERTIVYDEDGSFSSNVFDGKSYPSSAITKNFKHLAGETACHVPSNPSRWDDGLLCDNTVVVRRVSVAFPQPMGLFQFMPMKIQRLNAADQVVDENSTDYTTIITYIDGMESMIDPKYIYSYPMIAGRIYACWWFSGIDFEKVTIWFSKYYRDSDQNILLKFNHTNFRQFYQIQRSQTLGSVEQQQTSLFDIATCTNGQFYHDNNQSTLTYCISNRNRPHESTSVDIIATYCHYVCPSGEFTKENRTRIWSDPNDWIEGMVPVDQENRTVQGPWTMFLDVQPACLDLLIIDGTLLIENRTQFPGFNLCAKNIWIRAGTLRIGNQTTPFAHQFTIQLNGKRTDPSIPISYEIAGNKMIVVTGSLQIYGSYSGTSQTRLTQAAFKGATTMKVQACLGWKVGDQIGISPSFSNRIQYEALTITAISGNIITFTPQLSYTHYGSVNITINNAHGTLDTRAVVVHLTRNIRIVSSGDPGWGFRIISYGLYDPAKNITRRGTVKLIGVQLKQGGQYNTDFAAFSALNTQYYDKGQSNLIQKSSFHKCGAMCINIKQAQSYTIRNNVLFEAVRVHIQTQKITKFTVKDNAMIGAINVIGSVEAKLVACYQGCKSITDPITDKIVFENNVCQGSQGVGFMLPSMPCQRVSENPFRNNEAGSCEIGFLFEKYSSCNGVSNVKSFACYIGHMSSSGSTTKVVYENIMAIDCIRGMTLRFGGATAYDNSALLRNSYFNPISRPECSYCYGENATKCVNGQGIRLLTTTINAQSAPKNWKPDFDVICRVEQLDARVYMNNNTFENFNIKYAQSSLRKCSDNVIFRPHVTAANQIGSHNLWNSTVKNTSIHAYAHFAPPQPAWLGWFGGCGNFPCTGRSNYLIEDHDGTFLPGGGTLVPNNTAVGQGLGCQFSQSLNGHHCKRNDLGILEYQAIPAMHSRIMWPVTLRYDGSNFETKTNGYKQWQWDGNQPLNKRFARFLSIIKYGQTYNMSFAGTPPQDFLLQTQKKYPNSGDQKNWIIVKLHYPFPNSIRVENMITKQVIRPIPLLDLNAEEDLITKTSQCGANKFFYQNYTIHFVVNGNKNCRVRITLTNSIQLTTHFSMNVENFYLEDTKTKYIDRVAALLGIKDTYRIKIVSIYNGSAIVKMEIEDEIQYEPESALHPTNTQQIQSVKNLGTKLQGLIDSGAFNTEMIKHGLGPVISSSFLIHTLQPQETFVDNPENPTIDYVYGLSIQAIAGIVVGVVILIAMVIVVAICIFKRRSSKVADLVSIISEEYTRKVANTQETILEEGELGLNLHKIKVGSKGTDDANSGDAQ